ncbi:MAG: histidine phosphatase family protein [Alphaproteobacteria bacterium]|nr:histidine phosphatase family protein [Alphaproteobacteria bacterium]
MTYTEIDFDCQPRQLTELKERALQGPRFEYGVTPFYFLRHGETYESREGILQGQNETELSTVGRRMAEDAAETVSNLSLASIYASPLKRAWSTASIVSGRLGVPVHSLPGLMERHWGSFQGTPKAERPMVPNPETVETVEDFRGRVMDAMRSISGPAPVLVVAHSGVFRAICESVGISKDGRVKVATGQVVKFEPPTASSTAWRLSTV